jgi:hypothetical protein
MMSFQLVMLFNAIVIVKYIFRFHMKNPTVLQDDFWRVFINLWILGVSSIFFIVHNTFPGEDCNTVFYISMNVLKHSSKFYAARCNVARFKYENRH